MKEKNFEVNKLVINDFSNIKDENNISNDIKCDYCYNVVVDKKILKSSHGIEEASFPEENVLGAPEITFDFSMLSFTGINRVIYFTQYFATSNTTSHRMLIHGNNSKSYMQEMFFGVNYFNLIPSLTFDTAPIGLQYKLNDVDSVLLSSNEKMMVWRTNANPYLLENVPIITSMCIANQVLFCTIKDTAWKIWYCTDLNPENIGTVGTNTFSLSLNDERGYARKVICFKENVYVFRDYGITRLNYYSSTNVVVNHIYLSDSLIYAETIALCGDNVVFLTKNGLYTFNGVSVKKLGTEITNYIDKENEYAVASSLQNKYYLACRTKLDSNKVMCENNAYKNNALITYDLKDDTYEVIRGVDIKTILALKAGVAEKVWFTFNTGNIAKIGQLSKNSRVFNENLPKYYLSNWIMVDDLNKITIRKIKIVCSSLVNLKIITDKQTKTFHTWKDGTASFKTIIPCNRFKIEISSNNANIEVRHIEIEYEKSKNV